MIFMGSKYRGLYAQNASPYIADSVFSQNDTGFYNSSGGYSILNNCAVYDNSSYGVYNSNTSYTLNVANNWWGDDTGPTHTTNPDGLGDSVSDHVSYSPWQSITPVPLPSPLPEFPAPPIYTEVSGTLTSNTTWTLAQSPYIVTDNVTVNPGVQLSIEPGVVVKFQNDKYLTVNGILAAAGTADDHIIFTSVKDDSVGVMLMGTVLRPGLNQGIGDALTLVIRVSMR